MRLDIMPIATEKQIMETEQAAYNIWRDYYKNIFSPEQIEYMIKIFHSKEAVRKQIQNGHIHMVILLDGSTVGYMVYYVKNDCLILPRLYIKPEYRRQGLARQVIERLENIFLSEEHGLTYIKKIQRNLSVRNETAITIYEHLGFRKKKQITVDLGKGYFSDDYIMEKCIKPH